MPKSATDPHTATGTAAKLSALASHYAPGQERPLGSYAILTGAFGAGLTGSLMALRAHDHELPERLTTHDVLLVGAPRLTRLLGTVFVAHTISDFLQVAYRAAEDQL